MKLNKILIAIFTLICVTNFTSCVEDGDFSTPNTSIVDPNLTATMSIEALLASYKDQPIFFSDDTIISGYVASSDETGNIYKSLVIQDAPENPKAGIAISIDQSGLFSTYEVGRKVYVKLKGLVFAKSNNLPTIGAGIDGNFVTRLTTPATRKAIIRSTEVATMVPKTVFLSKLTEADLNQFITVKKAQFINEDLGLYYANPNNNDSANRTIVGCEDAGKLIVRNSGFASFRAVKLPEGSGEISGVLSRYNDDMQLYIKSTEDVKFTEARCTPSFQDVDITTNTTLKLIKEKYSGNTTAITQDLIFEAYVTSSDQAGNIYKVLYVQDKPENPEHGIQILVNKNAIYQDYQVGRKVYVKAKGLYIDKINDVLTLGAVQGLDVVRIPEEAIKNHIIAGNSATLVPKVVTIDDILNNENLVSTLVKINDMQLLKSEVGEAYANANNTYTVNRTLEECSSNTSIILRNSGYSSFKDQEFPTKKGSITALVSRYKSVFQLYIRDTNDVNFTGDRCDPLELDCGALPPVGTNVVYEENFESVSSLTASGWTNINTNGGAKVFDLKSFGGNTYIQAAAYKSKENPLEIWAVTPAINFDSSKDEILTFETKTGYNNGKALTVWASNDFTGDPKTATWYEITDATIADGPSNGYQSSFTNSGSINVSCLQGDVHIGFRYLGGDGAVTTTFQIDNVKIVGN